MTDSLEARPEHEPECERSKTCTESPYHDHTWRGDCVIPCICPALRAAFARGVESRPPVDVEAALDEWLTLAELKALPVGSVVLDGQGVAWERRFTSGRMPHWGGTNGGRFYLNSRIHEVRGPLHLLHTGTVTTREGE